MIVTIRVCLPPSIVLGKRRASRMSRYMPQTVLATALLLLMSLFSDAQAANSLSSGSRPPTTTASSVKPPTTTVTRPVNPLPKTALAPANTTANAAQVAAITELEMRTLGRAYVGDVIENRLARMERFVYGEAKEAYATDNRIGALQRTIPDKSLDEQAPMQPAPMPAQVANQLAASQNQQPRPVMIPGNSGSIPMPQGQPYSQPAFQQQAQALGGQQPLQQPMPQSPGVSGNPQWQNPQIIAALDKMESKVYRRNFPYDPPEMRMNRLEMTMFNEAAPEMTPDERLYRVGTIIQAQEDTQQENLAGGAMNVGPMVASPNVGGAYSQNYGMRQQPLQTQRRGNRNNGFSFGVGSGMGMGGFGGIPGGGMIMGGRGGGGGAMNSLLWILLNSLL
jgi:hypothetical protein